MHRPGIQRKVLEQKMEKCQSEEDWKIEELLKDLDKQISTEERINIMVARDPQLAQVTKSKGNSQPNSASSYNSAAFPCMFCQSARHRAFFCTKYPTLEQRRSFFEEHKRCFNCAKEGHSSKQCTGNGCKLCSGKKHHHTICPQRIQRQSFSQN